MKKQGQWNRREFIVKPVLWTAAASVLGKANLLLGTPGGTVASPLVERVLGKTGIKLPVVSMGVMNADVPGLLRRAYELGIRLFDTAAGYQEGRNEEMVGRVIQEMGVRDQVTVATKQAARNHRQSADAGKAFIDGVEASLKRLRMDHVDILYYHSVDSVEDARAEGPLQALQTLKKDGKARFVGISTHKTVDVLNEAMRLNVFDVALVTLNYTMANDTTMLGTIERAAKSGLGIIAMKTQAGGTTRPDSKLPKELPAASQTALLKWVLNHQFVTTAIPGVAAYDHLEQDFSVARNLAYTDDEKKFLADKNFVAEAEFCKQCGQCVEDCPQRVNIPALMRSHMYEVQYKNSGMARQVLADVPAGRGLDACKGCGPCLASCQNTVQIGRKIAQLKALQFV